jgi:hypothetical protein
MKLDFYANGNRTVWGLFRDFTVGFRRHIYGHFIDYYMQVFFISFRTAWTYISKR